MQTQISRCRQIRGFTLPEVVLAAFLLTGGILTVVNMFSAAHRVSFDTRAVIIAAGLAQEGVEVVRNIRDNNFAYRLANWTTGDNCQASRTGNCDPFRYIPTGSSTRCTVNYNSSGTGALTCPPTQLWLSATGGRYIHVGGTTSNFYRLIKINRSGAGANETVRVQSFVTWQDPLANLNANTAVTWCETAPNKCVYTETFLTAWR